MAPNSTKTNVLAPGSIMTPKGSVSQLQLNDLNEITKGYSGQRYQIANRLNCASFFFFSKGTKIVSAAAP